ncbi:hypothetical protein [Rhizobium halophytocola]|uniref:Zinc-finger domain-containing protein n=1 Tax=Rhizobium halophytocola TaxID=735519 RepID=A0ABS4DUF6_9HYPH|nr:hypothetical protein [Rhizobium halophytocola]MBP1849333.1 hypothetical protein [Rhizobium halophytocola]
MIFWNIFSPPLRFWQKKRGRPCAAGYLHKNVCSEQNDRDQEEFQRFHHPFCVADWLSNVLGGKLGSPARQKNEPYGDQA